jgi:hypothetical protein
MLAKVNAGYQLGERAVPFREIATQNWQFRGKRLMCGVK